MTQARQQGDSKTRRAIIKILKMQGPLGSAQLAGQLGLTAMAVRQHLYALQHEGHVEAEERPVPIGRPAKHWRLTREADQLFPEAHAELNVSLTIFARYFRRGRTGPGSRFALCATAEGLRETNSSH